MKPSDMICPLRGDVLHEHDDVLRSAHGISYPIVGGVPIIVQGVQIEPRAKALASPAIEELLDALALPPSRRAEVSQIFSQKFTFVEEWIQTEADQFLNRVAASHEGLRRALKLNSDVVVNQWPINVDPSVSISSIFKITQARPLSMLSVNLRVENCGNSTLASNGPSPINLSYHWIGADGASQEGLRTPLLDDLLPGRSISLPVFVETPATCGNYKLSIRAVQEGVQWFEGSKVEFDVAITDGPSSVDDPAWERTGKQFDYMADHFEGVRLLGEWRDSLFTRPVELVVELGGNANPMIDRFDAPHKFNVDIDPYGMIIGNLVRQDSDSTVRFIVADGMALPMRPRSVDMLVMFATFHHFPDPVGLLTRLSDFVADDGLICLMCEPIGHVQRDTLPEEYLGEIRKGVNEQSFDLWEYQQMFTAAKLEVAVAQIDVGSAKFALRRHAPVAT